MLFGIKAGIVYGRASYIYVLRQIGQIRDQIGQKNLLIYHMYTDYHFRSLEKLRYHFTAIISWIH